MIVLRSTMEAAVAAERERVWQLAKQYGAALDRVTALQKEMQAWLMNKADDLTPERVARMFYMQDDRWQAAFFNTMQEQVEAHHEAQPPASPREYSPGPGFPAGESQWCWMSYHLNDSGFQTIEAMFDHAKSRREASEQEAA